MKSLQKLTILSLVLALGIYGLVSPALSLAEETASDSAQVIEESTPTPTNQPDTSNCIATDVKGNLNYSGDHISGNPVTGFMENIATNADCLDEVYVHIFGSNNPIPHVGNWLESQVHVATQTFTIPQGGSKTIEVSVPNGDYCWYQVDATRTSEVRIPPVYNGNDMIDYVLVKNKDCGEVTPTPTVTVTPTQGPTATPTPGSSNNTVSGTSETKTVESIQATLGTSTMASTGGFEGIVANTGLLTGMIVSALGALSYAKDKKASRSF